MADDRGYTWIFMQGAGAFIRVGVDEPRTYAYTGIAAFRLRRQVEIPQLTKGSSKSTGCVMRRTTVAFVPVNAYRTTRLQVVG